MRRKLRTLRRALAVTVLLAFTTWMAVDRLTSSPPWPNPNGYDDFVKAGQMVTTSLDRRRDLGDYRELGLQDLREFASTNAEALKIARGALDRRCCMPLKNSQDWFRAHLGEMLSFKHLTFVFCL